MINYSVQKYYFHNSNRNNQTVDKIKTLQPKSIKKKIVDINKLLNRVRLDEKKQTKKKVIFFSLLTLVLMVIGTFITIIK
jgi:hypothetical protein